MKLAVLGPNGIEDASFHVHRAGCKDVARQERKFMVDKHWTMDVVSEREAIEVMFDDFIGTEETFNGERYTTWLDYQMDARFFPCTSGMPAE
jgi:hypothetical protein